MMKLLAAVGSSSLTLINHFYSLRLLASHRTGPIRPRGDDLSRHIYPLFLWQRQSDCSAGGNPPPVPHVGFSLFVGQHLRHVPILRASRMAEENRGRRRRTRALCPSGPQRPPSLCQEQLAEQDRCSGHHKPHAHH